jgi:hypothetical protein
MNPRADARRTTQKRQQRAQQNPSVDRIRLRPPRPTIHRQSEGLHHMDLDPAPRQEAPR